MKLVNADRIIKEVEERFDGVVTVNELVALCNNSEPVDAEIVSRCRNCKHLSSGISQVDGLSYHICTLHNIVTHSYAYPGSSICCPEIISQLERCDAKS